MKNIVITTSFVTALTLSPTALFASDKYHSNYVQSFQDMAKVTHVEPIYTTVRVATPQRECRDRSHRSNYNQHESYTSTIAGGIIGGVIGNQFGQGSGNTVMTVAGTLLGGSIGRDLGYNAQMNSRYNHDDNCQITERYHQEQRIDGYHVTYRYQGQTYTTEMDNHPGKRIPVEVSVQPAHRYY